MQEAKKKELIALEVKLHQSDVRKDPKILNQLISDSFLEIGTSGQTYRKEDILRELPVAEAFEIRSSDFEVRELQEGVAQVVYKAEISEQMSYRSSIWVLEKDQWKMVFHQGTKLTGD